jgi:hypothetical protein
MQEQVGGAESDRAPGQPTGGMQEVGRQVVVGILGELVLSQGSGQAVDRGGCNHEEEQAAGHLEDAVEALEHDPDQKCLVEEIPAFQESHAVPPCTGTGLLSDEEPFDDRRRVMDRGQESAATWHVERRASSRRSFRSEGRP